METVDPRRLARKARAALHYGVIARLRREPIDPELVLYEAFAGSGMLDNPEAIFDRLRRDPAFSGLRHVWVIADAALRRRLAREWRGQASVRFVPRGGVAYWRALSTAGTLVNNATFPPEFAKRPGQRYLNTWHGTPLKLMGYDMPDGPRESVNTLRNLLQADWLLSQSAFMTDTMYRAAYRLDGIYGGAIIEEGYPRTDRQHLEAAAFVQTRERLIDRGVELGDKPILLYAPTWRGGRFSEVRDDVAELTATVRRLRERVGDRYTVLLKTHQSVFRFAAHSAELARMLVPNDLPTNAVLGVTELLVTDYSSIQFDFLATGRPMAFLVPDLDEYAGSRGLYLPLAEWPGPRARTVDELADAVLALSAGEAASAEADAWAEARADAAQRFTPHDDGRVTERVIDVVFRGRGAGRRVRRVVGGERTRVLLHLGGMRSNGITSAGITLARALAAQPDFDVSVVFTWPEAEERRRNAERLGAGIRQLMRQGGMNATRIDHLRRRRGLVVGDRVWQGEWQRCFGSARFDVVVDFSGYAPFWAQLMLASPPARRVMWLHNDLARDAERTVHGRARLRAGLREVFGLYERFDRLISVSEELDRINSASLAAHAPRGSFGWVPNLIDAETIRARAAAPLSEVTAEAIVTESPALAAAVARLVSEQPAGRWLATVGRLSPEKNHARLIRAFARAHAARPDARLLIVGDGPLRAELEALAAAEGVADAVVFAGATGNPHALLAHVGCFVLSSDYEGMPMVLLEAAALRLPIVTTGFGSVADALPGVPLRIAEQSDESLAAALIGYLDGEVPPTAFDAEAHNAMALEHARAALAPARVPVGESGPAAGS